MLGENVSQAAQFALSGNAEGGIIAYSLALAPEVAAQGDIRADPARLARAAAQRMVLLKGAGPVAEEFYAYIQSPAARAIMEHYGFVLPRSERVDWTALFLSLRLAGWTVAILLPVVDPGGALPRLPAVPRQRSGGGAGHAAAGPAAHGVRLLPARGLRAELSGRAVLAEPVRPPLVFTFEGLLVASVIFNLPFAIQPVQRGFEAIPAEVREAAACCGLSPLASLWRVELPLAWPGILTAMVLTFAHTLGEFGIVLMVGGSIPGETKTIAIAIYDRVQAFDRTAPRPCRRRWWRSPCSPLP